MQGKTTRAFRTISEAGDELGLQPHVLRFWESKFPEIKPIKRNGGRRFYRPEDIELLRGIKILLHDENHAIKDVQKLIRIKGVGRLVELGRSVQIAAKPKDIKDTVLIPERLTSDIEHTDRDDLDRHVLETEPQVKKSADVVTQGVKVFQDETAELPFFAPPQTKPVSGSQTNMRQDVSLEQTVDNPNISDEAKTILKASLKRLTALRQKWDAY